MKISSLKTILLFTISSFLAMISFVLYYQWLGNCVVEGCTNGFLLPYNIPDYQVFFKVIRDFDDFSFLDILTKNYGVTLPYVLIVYLFDVDLDTGMILMSAIVNWIIYIASGYIFVRLCSALEVKRTTIVWFMFFPPFIFFSVLINKDSIMIFLVLAITLAVVRRHWFLLLLLTIAVSLIRLQYVIFPMMLVFLVARDFRWRFLIVYTATAFMSAVIVNIFTMYDIDWSAGGFSYQIYYLNKNYFIGSFLLNPLRLVHYVVAFIQECFLAFSEDGVDLMKVIQGVTFLYLMCLAPGCMRFLIRTWRGTVVREFSVIRAAIFSYFLVLLLTPITEPRYFMIGCPLLLLASNVSVPSRFRTSKDSHEEDARIT